MVRDYEQWRRGQAGKPSRGALREYWRQRDQRYAKRPDYMLWRQTQCLESPPEQRQNAAELAMRGLRHPDPMIHWAVLALVPALLEDSTSPPLPSPQRAELIAALAARVGGAKQPKAPNVNHPSRTLIAWLGLSAGHSRPEDAATLLTHLHDLLLAARPDWKLGRSPDFGFLQDDGAAWLPISATVVIRRLAGALSRIVRHAASATIEHASHAGSQVLSLRDVASWQFTAWLMLRDARPDQSLPRAVELEMLLDAATLARAAGQHHEAARLATLVTHLLPPQTPEPLLRRCRVAAWMLAEAGLAPPANLRVTLDDMPFPGEPPASEKGQEANRLFDDPADLAKQALAREVAGDPHWQRLRATGVALHHPLAALAWIGKKAQTYALKKQTDVLQTAAHLAARHHCITTTGRILAQSPGSAEAVLDFARAMRQSLRRMPLLRDAEVWQDWRACLRAAWGRLDTDAIHDPEGLFLLHETLLDREITTLRSLPMELRLLALRHLHSRRAPSPLVQNLEAEPRQMQSLEHQRPIELWSVAAESRGRPEMARTVWISLVLRGDAAAGRYSLLVHGPSGGVQTRGRLRSTGGNATNATSCTLSELDVRPLLQDMVQSVAKAGTAPEWVLLAVDPDLASLPWQTLLDDFGLPAAVSCIPSWEWAFRVLRESSARDEPPFEILLPEAAPASTPAPLSTLTQGGPLAHACVLLAGAAPTDANTRWSLHSPSTAGKPAETRRSLAVGAHPLVLSHGPLVRGDLAADLVRLSLAQATRLILAPAASPTELQPDLFEPSDRVPLSERLRTFTRQNPSGWSIHGLPWLGAPEVFAKG